MIVTCSECDTQFKLDDSKIAGHGLNVRCSVCKHAFFVGAPGAETEDGEPGSADAFDRVAGAAIEAAFSEALGATPESTEDLVAPLSDSPDDDDDISGALAPRRGTEFAGESESGESSESSESDWEFSHDPDTEAGAAAAEPRAASGAGTAAERAVDELLGSAPRLPGTSEDPVHAEPESGLGDPEDWDFFGNEGGDLGQDSLDLSEAAASSPHAAPTVDAPIGPIAPKEGAPPQQLDPGVSHEAPFADLPVGVDDRSTLPEGFAGQPISRTLRRTVNLLGWISVLALVTLGIHSGLKIQRMAPRSLETQRVGGTIVESLEGQWIENMHAGPLFVVSGTLRNDAEFAATAGSVLVLRLYDESGRPLESPSAMVGPALTERQIREDRPDELIARLELGAARASREPLARGESRRFHAILPDVPPAAKSFRLESAPLSLEVP